MHRNYEILKEHELNIIRDIQEKKISDLRELTDQINSLKRILVDKEDSIKERERSNQELRDQIRRIEFDLEQQVNGKKVLDDNQSML